MRRYVKTNIFLAYGFLIWVPCKIFATMLLVIPFLFGGGQTAQVADVDTHIDSYRQRVAVLVDADLRPDRTPTR